MTFVRTLSQKAWIWSFLGMFLVWLATAVYTGGKGSADVISAALSFATFTVIVGIAATLIANAIDLPGHPAIRRETAREIDPDSDLGNRLANSRRRT